MTVLIKIDGKCVGCALGVVFAYIPEDVQIQIVLTIPSGPEEDTQFSKLVLSTSEWNSVQEILLGGWRVMIRRYSPSGLSSCHLTHNLLLVMPGVFVDTVAWLLAQFLASTLQTATSFRLHDILWKKNPEENRLLSREDPTTWLSHCILEENMHKMTVAQMTQISCIYKIKSTEDGGLRVTVMS